MLSDKQRQQLITEAKSWVGTPFRACSCLKGAGVDCMQLIKGTYLGSGVINVDAIPTPSQYSVQANQHQVTNEYRDTVLIYMREIPESEVKPGDVVLYKNGLSYGHGGIINEWPRDVIHATNHHGVTSGDARTLKFKTMPKQFFTLRDEFVAEEK
jgi:cell wall-associated NlpC family hydrolase